MNKDNNSTLKDFLIEVENKAEKQIKKLDFSIRKKVNDKIKNLRKNPFPKNPKHFLASRENTFLGETAIEEIRIYYIFVFEKIVILKIKYIGKLKILEVRKKSGTQQKKIKKLKKDFLKSKSI